MGYQEYGDEEAIVWIRDPKSVPYLREGTEIISPKDGNYPRSYGKHDVYGYSKLSPGAEGDQNCEFWCRVWYRTKGDPFQRNGCPVEGRKISSIVAGKPSIYGRDW